VNSAPRSRAPIGVFDSGVGGLSVLRALRAHLPQEDFVYLSDAAHAPYGERSEEYVGGRALRVADFLLDQQGVKALVVACNTATAAAVQALRARWPALPIIGIEPALKPAAAASQTRVVGVMATRGTLESGKFKALLDGLEGQARFVLQPCDGLAAAIEEGDADATLKLCKKYIGQLGPFGGSTGRIDQLVLGCTHYPLVGDVLQTLVGPDTALVDPGGPVSLQTRRVLDQAGLLHPNGTPGTTLLLSTGAGDALRHNAQRWLGLDQPVGTARTDSPD